MMHPIASFRVKLSQTRRFFVRSVSGGFARVGQLETRDQEQLREWVARQGAKHVDKVKLQQSLQARGGTGLFSAQNIKANEEILRIPRHLTVSHEVLVEQIEEGPKDDSPSLIPILPWKSLTELSSRQVRAQIGMWLMHETAKESDSWYHPWFKCLPKSEYSTGNNVFIGGGTLPARYLRDLQSTEAFTRIVNIKVNNDLIWKLFSGWIAELPYNFKPEDFQRREYDHFVQLAGRGFLQDDTMVPVMDFLNHPNLRAMENATIGFDNTAKEWTLTAMRNIDKDEELFANYGWDKSNARLFSGYGFTTASNPENGALLGICRTKFPDTHLAELVRHFGSVGQHLKVDFNDELPVAWEKGNVGDWHDKFDEDNEPYLGLKITSDYPIIGFEHLQYVDIPPYVKKPKKGKKGEKRKKTQITPEIISQRGEYLLLEKLSKYKFSVEDDIQWLNTFQNSESARKFDEVSHFDYTKRDIVLMRCEEQLLLRAMLEYVTKRHRSPVLTIRDRVIRKQIGYIEWWEEDQKEFVGPPIQRLWKEIDKMKVAHGEKVPVHILDELASQILGVESELQQQKQ